MEDPRSAGCRTAAFKWLQTHWEGTGDTIPREALRHGFTFEGERVQLIGPQGIFKPRQIAHYPLSITTTTKSPYSDSFEPGTDFLLYSYRGRDPEFHENRRLRNAMHDRIPLIYFFSTIPGRYLAIWPVYVVGDNPSRLQFTVAADEPAQLKYERDDSDEHTRRSYTTRLVRQRMHQRSFRDRVLQAYQERCSICRLHHSKLLDAAHIIGDTKETGEPVVRNGLSLCKIHHAAFDNLYFGIRPDYEIVVQPEIMEEEDGPMLKHGLQEIHGSRIFVPSRSRDRPDPERLRVRFNTFAEAANL
ncbi:HNH endonuclease [Lentisalinibacter sediminis]|uniref:HNH endonuclease n=1 Tax=Lentisalinibacter sediminis TaxID=2992237 RepID=UPI00386CE804